MKTSNTQGEEDINTLDCSDLSDSQLRRILKWHQNSIIKARVGTATYIQEMEQCKLGITCSRHQNHSIYNLIISLEGNSNKDARVEQ